jgi:predicted O-methyltransferase YrrM
VSRSGQPRRRTPKRALLRAARIGLGVKAVVRHPPWAPPGHYSSPTTSLADIERALSWSPDLPGVELREREQVELARALSPSLAEAPRDRYRPDNAVFSASDAALHHAMLRYFRPRRVIEVGCGHSTAVLLDTAQRHSLEVDLTCIEPYPERLLALLRPGDDLELIRAPVQEVPLEAYARLEAGDLLFIDSTHVVKAGSDVLWLYLHVLPRLAPGVLVQIHDVFWPFEYPEEWLREGRDWNEDYFLHAFLCHNQAWEMLLFGAWLWRHHLELVPEAVRMPGAGGLWMRRRPI